MAHQPRFQALILPNLPWGDLLGKFQHVETLGFDLAVTGDHFVDWTNPPAPWGEMWTLLAGVAQATETIRLAPCVAQIPLRLPSMLAREALTVEHVSGGRLEIGLGLGLPIDPSYKMAGIPNWSNRERADRFKEYVEIVDSLLSNEVTTYKGEFYEVDGAYMNPRPIQKPRPPITIAALGPRMMGYAATYADTWNTMSFAEDFDDQLTESAGRIARVKTLCEKSGRDPDSLRLSYNMFDAQARHSGGRICYYESVDVFADMAGKLMDLGFSELGLYYPTLDDQIPTFETIAREVLPALRARS